MDAEASLHPARPDGRTANIKDVFSAEGAATLAYLSYSAPSLSRGWPGGEHALEGVPLVTQQRLLSVLASLDKGNDRAINAICAAMTVGQFVDAAEPIRLAFINRLWDAVATPHAFNTLAANMVCSPIATDDGRRPLPSSWCPVGGGKVGCHKRLVNEEPWRRYGVGFRVDGTNSTSITRILASGMTQQWQNTAFMQEKRGLVVAGTTIANPGAARFWTASQDIFNETAVCVSRNFFGATAFPERSSPYPLASTVDADAQGFFLLWAVDCMGLAGCDTEQIQLNLPGARHWRPGEKAFPAISRERIIGYVTIRRTGSPPEGGWSFGISAEAKWTICGHPTTLQLDYIQGELDAWRGLHNISPKWDFAE
jgi:hypothetical protein